MVRILVSDDIHMDRQPTHLPEGIDGRRLSASAGWLRLVEAAISEQVHAVVLSGDLIDRENRYFEAFGPLQTGLDRLAEADIETLAVVCNHDFDTLPRFSQNYSQELDPSESETSALVSFPVIMHANGIHDTNFSWWMV